ncbi:hypothetical protein [Kosakonia radicincitans]|uniref:hypothetical protein n=1 Tax=Kosakonia radicincitans TaxID=283686 RepID=UPI0008D65478|nr:hypothetical protein [Kosakonia radicincitans]SES92275.1 Endonuclease/Exonuclease/phosphatase family protein [Kosakonia radicincitans]
MNSTKNYFTTLPVSFLLLLVCTEGYAAVKFTIRSQNFLHLGWGTSAVNKNKCLALDEMMQANDVIIIQELMQHADPCPAETTKNKFQFIVNSTGLGSSSYKEYYGFYIKPPKVSFTNDRYQAGGTFERPPYAIGLKVTVSATSKYIWVGNIHSIFGKRVQQRYDEAAEVKDFYQYMINVRITGAPKAKNYPFIIGGDWNIPLKNKAGKYTKGFEWLTTNNAEGAPNVPTSLSAKGKRASAYDHFIYADSLTVNNVQILTSASFASDLSWRQNVTDHLGISAEVTIP